MDARGTYPVQLLLFCPEKSKDPGLAGLKQSTHFILNFLTLARGNALFSIIQVYWSDLLRISPILRTGQGVIVVTLAYNRSDIDLPLPCALQWQLPSSDRTMRRS